MKRFNIVKQDVILFEKFHIPVNACFGNFPTTYKKYVGTKQVLIKHCNNGFKDMKLINKKQFRTISENIIYYVDNFKPLKNYGTENYLAYEIHIYDKMRDCWHTVNTRQHPKYYALGEFLERMFEKNDIRPTTQCIKWVDYKVGAPTEKKAQIFSDSVYSANVGYALSKNVMTCHNINRDGWYYDNSIKSTL